VPTFISGSRN